MHELEDMLYPHKVSRKKCHKKISQYKKREIRFHNDDNGETD